MPRLWSQNHHAAPGTTPLKLPAVVASAIYIEGSSVYKIVCGRESLRSIASKSAATSCSGIGSPTQSPPASGPTVSNSRVHALRFTFRCSCIVTVCALYSCAKYTYISNRKLRNSLSEIVSPFSAFLNVSAASQLLSSFGKPSMPMSLTRQPFSQKKSSRFESAVFRSSSVSTLKPHTSPRCKA